MYHTGKRLTADVECDGTEGRAVANVVRAAARTAGRTIGRRIVRVVEHPRTTICITGLATTC